MPHRTNDSAPSSTTATTASTAAPARPRGRRTAATTVAEPIATSAGRRTTVAPQPAARRDALAPPARGRGRRDKGGGSISARTLANGAVVHDVYFTHSDPGAGATKRNCGRGFTTSAGAARYLRAQTSSVDEGSYVPPSRLLLRDYLEQCGGPGWSVAQQGSAARCGAGRWATGPTAAARRTSGHGTPRRGHPRGGRPVTG